MESSEGIESSFSEVKINEKAVFEQDDDQGSDFKPAFLTKAIPIPEMTLNMNKTKKSADNALNQDVKFNGGQLGQSLKNEAMIYLEKSKNEPLLLSDKLSIQSTDSSSIPKKEKKTRISDKWDNLELYFKILESKKNKENKKEDKKPAIAPLKIIQLVSNLVKKGDPFAFISETSVLKVFLVSSLMLFIQLKYSKKARVWLFYTLNIVLYLLGLTLSAGTLTLLALKIRSASKKSQDKKAVEKQNQEPENAPDASSEIKQI